VHEAEYAAQVSEADLETEKLTEQASLASYFFEIRGQDMLEQILKETVAADQKSLDYNQAQFDTGVGDYISVAEAKTTLEAAEATEVNVGVLRTQYEHAIAVLLGRPPSDFSIPVKPMLYTPPPIPTGVPSQLAERRPDIAAAERTLAEENAIIGIGYGAFFPQVTISASGGLESAAFKHLFDIASRTWSVGPSISQIIFNGFLYRAELHQYVAMYNADLASYRQTVLVAFQQVEDSLSATRIYSQQILRQQQAVKDSQDYLDLELVRYNTGVDPYVDVVIAQTTLLNNQEALNSLEVDEMTSAVELVQALGGGWDRTQLPTPDQAGAKTTNADYRLQQ
jgi:NodT family efflux transporter outer membrane factor (OMF) lipoprotein